MVCLSPSSAASGSPPAAAGASELGTPAKATFRKDRRLSIRLSSKDLEAIQKRALAEGLPIGRGFRVCFHKYVLGRLKKI